MSTSRTRRHLTLLSTAALAAGVVPALTAGPASAATTVTNQSFTVPGTYDLVIPPGTTQVSVTGLGGAGSPGNPSSSGSSRGGVGGRGTLFAVTYELPTGSVRAGDTLQIVVGAKGGGARGGSGSELSGSGGNGGGATYAYDGSDQTYLLVAAGGGGGGGGSGVYSDYIGGQGGTDGNGTPGIGTGDGAAGRGGAIGADPACTRGVYLTPGQPGEAAPYLSAVAGGGGGGAGSCGGQSGGSGNHGFGDGGGGGGGAGASRNAGDTIDVSRGWSNSTGDGYAVVTLTVASS
jgi:hypothetical protein